MRLNNNSFGRYRKIKQVRARFRKKNAASPPRISAELPGRSEYVIRVRGGVERVGGRGREKVRIGRFLRPHWKALGIAVNTDDGGNSSKSGAGPPDPAGHEIPLDRPECVYSTLEL